MIIEKGLALVSLYSNYNQGVFGDFIYTLQQNGFFSLIIPMLLIFALIYGIMTKMNMFGDASKTVNVVIALAVALIAIQFEMVPRFFEEIFPRMSVGITIILVLVILIGLFAPALGGKSNWFTYTIFGLTAIIFVIVLYNTAGAVGWEAGYWWQDNWELIVGAIFILALFGIVVASAHPPQEKVHSAFTKMLEKAAT